ncbi:hypothetical protein ABPG75_005850 [Micractinium tetrahymenae]
MEGVLAPAEPFAAQQGAAAASADGAALAVLAAVALARAPSLEGHWPIIYAACLVIPACCLAWQHLAPQSWRRWRVPGVVVCRLAALPLAAAVSLRATAPFQPLHASVPAQADAAAGPSGLLYLLFSTAYGSGAIVLALGAIGLRLPPLPSALLQAAGAAAMAATNPLHCASSYVRHPQAAAGMGMLYRWLEPLIAPLEPLLWLAGVGDAHSQRRCLCVLAALQFWGGLALPLLLVLLAEARSYRAHRRARLHTVLLRRRQEERSAARYWTRRRGACRRRSRAGASPPPPPPAPTVLSRGRRCGRWLPRPRHCWKLPPPLACCCQGTGSTRRLTRPTFS